MSIAEIIDGVIGREGHYSNHPSDKGGETMWGITVGVARENGYMGPMRDMPRDVAKAIYEKRFVHPFLGVIAIDEKIAEELVDTGVNMGPPRAALYLQMSLNALNRQGRDYPDITEDMQIGPVSLAALNAYIGKRGAEGRDVLLKALNALQGARYIELARARGKNEDFVYGWLRTRV